MSGARSRTVTRRWILLGAAGLLAAVVVLPPLINMGRYRRSIAASIGRSMGRQVHISSVTLRLAPRPGFAFSGFVVDEDSEFGSEPLLRCDDVVANLRLLSLWRGRLEVSSIHLDGASLNLVRNARGAWNFASILLQAANIPNAPTGQRHAGKAPRFPYIEAVNSRINFKQGDEKEALSFLNADLSAWLETPEQWQVRFEAQPARTDLDLDLADTGVLRIEGALLRARTLGAMPLRVSASWSGAPLGQLTRLTLGDDTGWRGNLSLNATVTGTADLARIRTRLRIDGLHRAELPAAQPLDVETSCQATYRRRQASLEQILCVSPVGAGALRLTGGMLDVQTHPLPDLALDIRNLPASSMLAVFQLLRSTPGLQILGAINGHFTYAATANGAPVLAGGMEAGRLNFLLNSGRNLALAPVRLLCEQRSSAGLANPRSTGAAGGSQPALVLQPLSVSMGAPAPITLDGRFTSSGFDLHLNGPATFSRLGEFSRAFGLLSGLFPAATRDASWSFGNSGTAALNLELNGPWLEPLPEADLPEPSSIAQGGIAVRGAELTAPFLAQPVKIDSAQSILGPQTIEWTNASIGYGPLRAQGTLESPLHCPPASPCPRQFQLDAATLNLGELQAALLGADRGGELLQQWWDRLRPRPAPWPALSGSFRIGTLSAGKLVVHDAAGSVEISGRSLHIASLNGRTLKGAVHLDGQVAMADGSPGYRMNLELTDVSPSAIAALFGEKWGSGTLSLFGQWKMTGFAARQLAESAAGTVRWDWSKGSFTPALEARSGSPFGRFDHWSGEATIADEAVRIRQSLMASGRNAIPVSGAISFDRTLDLKSDSATRAAAILGSLSRPETRIATAPTPVASPGNAKTR